MCDKCAWRSDSSTARGFTAAQQRVTNVRQMCEEVALLDCANSMRRNIVALRSGRTETSLHAASPEGEPHLPPGIHSAIDLLRGRRRVDRCRLQTRFEKRLQWRHKGRC